MVTCIVCKDELSEYAAIYIPERYVRRHHPDAVPAASFFSTFTAGNEYALSGCVEFPAELDEKVFKRWGVLSLTQQRDANAAIRRSLRRINNAPLALPEDTTATVRDEIEHERHIYGDEE